MAITRLPPLLQILLIIYINGCLGYHHIDGMRHLLRSTISSNSFRHFAGYRIRCQSGNLVTDSEPLRTSEEITRSDYEFLDCGDLKRLERFGGTRGHSSMPMECEIIRSFDALTYLFEYKSVMILLWHLDSICCSDDEVKSHRVCNS